MASVETGYQGLMVLVLSSVLQNGGLSAEDGDTELEFESIGDTRFLFASHGDGATRFKGFFHVGHRAILAMTR